MNDYRIGNLENDGRTAGILCFGNGQNLIEYLNSPTSSYANLTLNFLTIAMASLHLELGDARITWLSTAGLPHQRHSPSNRTHSHDSLILIEIRLNPSADGDRPGAA